MFNIFLKPVKKMLTSAYIAPIFLKIQQKMPKRWKKNEY